MKIRFSKIGVTFAITMVGFFIALNANAALITTNELVAEVATEVSRDQLLTALDRDEVRRALMVNGVDATAARVRVESMTDQEIAALQTELDSLPAGAGVGSVLVTVVLVFVILDIIGVTNVFTFIR